MKCAYCGRDVPKGRRKFCSLECYKADFANNRKKYYEQLKAKRLLKLHPMVVCPICGRKFDGQSHIGHPRRYCSPECSEKAKIIRCRQYQRVRYRRLRARINRAALDMVDRSRLVGLSEDETVMDILHQICEKLIYKSVYTCNAFASAGSVTCQKVLKERFGVHKKWKTEKGGEFNE